MKRADSRAAAMADWRAATMVDLKAECWAECWAEYLVVTRDAKRVDWMVGLMAAKRAGSTTAARAD